MFDGFYLEYPKVLSILMIFMLCASVCKMRVTSIFFPHTQTFVKQNVSSSRVLWILKWGGIFLLLLALSSPVKDRSIDVKPQDGIDIALILDASQSMSARGFNPRNLAQTRFDAVKDIVGKFIKTRVNDNIGVVVFGKYSFIAAPLTYDKNILSRIVSQLYIAMAGKYTALYEAVAQTSILMHNSKAKSKVAILLTDGYNTPGGKVDLDSAIEMIKKEKIRVYAIGIGQPNEYNVELLKYIAHETGGKAYGASTASTLQKIYKDINSLEKSKIEREHFTFKKYYYVYPLFVGFFFIMLYVYLRNKKGVM